MADLLRRFRVVAIVGARQVGKSTLARQIAGAWRGPTTFFDLENPDELARLAEPMRILEPLKGLVILDEVQRRPDLFPILRVLADRPRGPRFLVLGSASPALLRQTSESLAGRIAVHHLPGLDLTEVGVAALEKLWLRGGFPRSFTAGSDRASLEWRREFLKTFLERDLPQLGIRVAAPTLRRFWSMLAHVHGQTLNWSELGRSMGVADTTVRGYLDALEATFMVRTLPPWHENISKRQVKAPRAYLSDTGLLHALLDIPDGWALQGHPRVGASWEGFCLEAVVRHLDARPEQCFFWATYQGAELDLLVVQGKKRHGFEMKLTGAPVLTPSMRVALEDLKLDSLDVIHAGDHEFSLADRVRALPLKKLPLTPGPHHR
ncbi:MAG: ATP-binding protein [Myxococcaceae bacterium]